jgi:hypothetical protein
VNDLLLLHSLSKRGNTPWRRKIFYL